jgi:PAS domain S-box-containing protein
MRTRAAEVRSASQHCDRPGTKCLVARWSWILCVCVLAAFANVCSAAAPSTPKNVLVLYSFTDRKALDSVEVLKSATRTHTGSPVNFHIEYLETQRFESPGYENGVSEQLAGAYRRQKIDLVIPYAYPALRFAVEHREQIFPGAPIVFSSVAPDRLEGQKLWPGVTGITIDVDLHGTVDLALRLKPDAKNAAVVVGSSEFDRFWLTRIKQELRLHESKLTAIDLAGLAPAQLLEGIAALPPDTVVLFQLIPEEASQPVIGTYDILATIAQRFQTYCFFYYCLGRGAIGGSYADPGEQETMVGELAARVLSGEKPENIPVMQGPPAFAHFDWRQLRYWNIPESALPPGAIIFYRQPTGWERYGKYLIPALLLILLQAFLILGLLVRRTRERKSELRLLESEKRFRLMADTTPALVWMCDKDGTVTYLNGRRIDFTGRDLATGFGDTWSAFIHPDDVQSVQTANKRALEQQKEFSREYRLRRRDGVYRWMLDFAAPRVNGDGSFAGFIGSAADITDQKLAQEALEKIGGKLIEAQEEERSRIARELHDDICQRLALLSMELEQANRGSNSGRSPKLEEIRRHCAEIAIDVQALSHKLHSSKLEYLGLAPAIRSYCREFSQQHDVNVQFAVENVPNFLPRDISLSLFRVTQEALQNALKHSGTKQFSVILRSSANEIQLEVSDRGAGFDVEGAKLDRGLGLVSMQERAHLIHGTFTIESAEDDGTRILVRVPLADAQIKASSTVSESA